MVNPDPFHPDDLQNVKGPVSAFQRGTDTPNVYAQQHHLALEVVAHLHQDGVPLVFRGGTALHTKLPDRRRFSIDVDITTTSGKAVHESLKRFPERFRKSAVELVEPPRELRVEGVSHTLRFKNADPAIYILVEVVEVAEPPANVEKMRLKARELDWQVDVQAPTFSAFVGQKLAVLGPKTIGKLVGRNTEFARGNQGVCKQIFDLRELLRRPELDPASIIRAYDGAVEEGNRLRQTSHPRAACLTDARELLAHLRLPRLKGKEPEVRYGLWSGFTESKRWIADRDSWQDIDYRTAAGAITKLATQIEANSLDLERIRAPLFAEVPEVVRNKLAQAEANNDAWFVDGDFGGLLRVAWSWAPQDLL